MKAFARRLKELRAARDTTQAELAAYLGVSRPTVAGYERNKEPNQETLTKIAAFFGVTVDYLLGRTDERQPRTLDVSLHRTDGYDVDLPPEAIKSIEEFIDLMRIKYGSRDQEKGGGKKT